MPGLGIYSHWVFWEYVHLSGNEICYGSLIDLKGNFDVQCCLTAEEGHNLFFVMPSMFSTRCRSQEVLKDGKR